MQELESTRRKLRTANEKSVLVKERTLALNRQLSDFSAHLEKMIAERTEELVVQKTLLEQEVAVRRRAEEQSRRLTKRFQDIIDAMPVMIVSADADHFICQWNSAAENEFSPMGVSLFGMSIEDAVALLGIEQDKVRETYEKRSPLRVKVAKESGVCFYEIVMYPCHEGNDTGWVLIIEDVSKQVLLENELLKGEKLRSVGLLAGGIAHDFNNLLTSIMGNISIVRFEQEKQGSPSDNLRVAIKACVKARELTKQLLTFSKGGNPLKENADINKIREPCPARITILIAGCFSTAHQSAAGSTTSA